MITSAAIWLAEHGLLPDRMLRWGIRRLIRERLENQQDSAGAAFEESLREGPVALVPEKANEQHYEVPAQFFRLALGSHLKYSSAYWPEGTSTLDQAEAAMLELYGQRAELEDGQRILELGCGWGSLSLWMAHHYPSSRIVALSNSASQREYIEARAPGNLEVVTADINDFDTDERFDRVVSIEMFEHMSNYEALMGRVARWLAPGGKLFVHIFCHERLAYPFETEGADNWMGRHFFTGGIMPSFDLLERFRGAMTLERDWKVDGTHYGRTAEAWLENTDRNRDQALQVMAETYGDDQARVWLHRWRIFFLACAELFNHRSGREWLVGHYRFARL